MKKVIFSIIAVIIVVALSIFLKIYLSNPTLPEIDTSVSENGIVPMPDDVPVVFKKFDRYTKVVAPNGKPIHIAIEKGYSDKQAIYARKILINHLTDIPGSRYGSDKSNIANAIADSEAVLGLFHSTESLEEYRLPAAWQGFFKMQDLRAYETILEGTPEYMDNDDPVRDASYEEILHFVQGFGIEGFGSDGGDPELSAKIDERFEWATENNIYTLDSDYEYLICALEAYYDLWRHDPTGDNTREGEYIPISRTSLKQLDPEMYELIEEFFGPYWLYTAEVDSEFEGTFSLTYNESLTYTNKSQYLTKVMLTGVKNSNLVGNDQDNLLIGNEGDNEIMPLQGNDEIDGGEGNDRVLFQGESTEYTISAVGEKILVNDQVTDRDGKDSMTGVEELQFADKIISTEEILM